MTRILIVLLLLLVLAEQTSAAGSSPASVRELIILGLEKNLGLQVEELNIPVAAAEIELNQAVFDAELFAVADYAESSTPVSSSLSLLDRSETEQLNGEIGIRKRFHSGMLARFSVNSEWIDDNNLSENLAPRYRTMFDLQLNQPLLRNFGSAANTIDLNLARNQSTQVRLQHLLQAQRLALQIELLASQFAGEAQILVLRSDAVALANELYAANKRRFDTGIIPVSEVQEAATALASRELNLSLAQQGKDLNFEKLNRQLNHALGSDFDGETLYLFAADLAAPILPDIDVQFAMARNKNLSLQLAAVEVRNRELKQDYSQNQLKPQLDLNLLAGLNGFSGDEQNGTGSRYAGSWGDSFSSVADAEGYQWRLGMEFSLPLGNRAANARLQQANLQVRQANYRQRDLETELRSELHQQTINLQRAFEQVKIARRFEALAELSLRQEQRRLEEGLSDTFRIISFQDNMINAKIGRINALIQYYASVAQLSFTRGIILEQYRISLATPMEERSRETL